MTETGIRRTSETIPVAGSPGCPTAPVLRLAWCASWGITALSCRQDVEWVITDVVRGNGKFDDHVGC